MELRQPARVGSDCRYDDGGNLSFSASQLPQNVPAGAVRQVNVQQDQIGPLLRYRADGSFRRVRFADSEPATGEVTCDDSAQRGLILNDQNTTVQGTCR